MAERKEIVKMADYPSNSKTLDAQKRSEPAEDKKVEKVIKGSVRRKKPSAGKKLAETFLGDDIKNVLSYVFQDVLVPAAKNMFEDMVNGGIHRLLHGDDGHPPSGNLYRDRGKTYANYGGISSGRQAPQRDRARANRAQHDFDTIYFDSGGEAEVVLSALVDLTIDYGRATVADFYDLVGISPAHTDYKYGWENLGGANTYRAREGYVIRLPRPILLD